jgi:hypothetical protein
MERAPLGAIEWTRGLTDLQIITLAALVVMVVGVLAALVWAMIEGDANKESGTVSFKREPDERLIWLTPEVVNRLRALRGPGESYSDVILRLVEGTVSFEREPDDDSERALIRLDEESFPDEDFDSTADVIKGPIETPIRRPRPDH